MGWYSTNLSPERQPSRNLRRKTKAEDKYKKPVFVRLLEQLQFGQQLITLINCKVFLV
jgi:hypothetical protein